MSSLRDHLSAVLEDGYAVRRRIAIGPLAAVFEAVDRKHDRRVAIKVLRPDVIGAIGTARFLREIRIAATLNHPHVMPLLDSGEAEGLVWYVMPFVDGESLQSRLDRQGPLPVDEALTIAAESADALGHAHERGIVHRDVKPGNVLLTGGRAVVTDFGIAKVLQEVGDTEVTSDGLAMGTPLYMSPEQASGEGDVDGRADVYALGCVLYEMLAGEPPFGGPTARVVMARHLAATPPSVSIARPGLTPAVEAIVERCLRKEPADRYGSAAALGSALRDALRHPERPGRTPRPRPTRRAALAALLVLVVGGLGASWIWSASLRNAGTGAPPPGGGLDPARLAVLPIEAVGDDPVLEGFAESLTSRLTVGLGSIEELTVISRLGVRPWVDAAVPVDSIARALAVGTLIEGGLEGMGDSLRVRVSLVDGGSGETLGTASVRAPFPDRLSLMDEVADSVETLLRRSLGPSVKRRRRLLETGNVAAFESLRLAEERAREFDRRMELGRFAEAAAVLEEQDSLLARAEELDPRWIEPTVERAALAQHRLRLAEAVDRRADVRPILETGLAHAERALSAHPRDPRALRIRGVLRYQRWQAEDAGSGSPLLAAAERDLRDALEGSPDQAVVLRHLSDLLRNSGRPLEALEAGQRAYARDPFFENAEVLLLRLFDASLALGRDEDAARWCREGLSRFSDQPFFHHCALRVMAWTDAEAADPERAWRLREATLEPYAAPPPALESNLTILVAAVLARAGLPDSARAVLDGVPAGPKRTPGDALATVAVLARLGDDAAALRVLDDYLADNPERAAAAAASPELRAVAGREPYLSRLESGR